jgi:hypothetical protein
VKHRSTHITSLKVVQQKHMRVQGMSIEVHTRRSTQPPTLN